MKRQVSLDEISDGRLYELNDMVKAGCNDCIGCADCCGGMGNSIILDPLDCHRLVLNLKITFEELLVNRIELNVVEGIILPNLKMTMSSEKCSFLDEKEDVVFMSSDLESAESFHWADIMKIRVSNIFYRLGNAAGKIRPK